MNEKIDQRKIHNSFETSIPNNSPIFVVETGVLKSSLLRVLITSDVHIKMPVHKKSIVHP